MDTLDKEEDSGQDKPLVPKASSPQSPPGTPPPRGGYLNAVSATFGHALLTALRRRRLVLAAVVTLLPVLIPLAMAFLSASQFQDDGSEIFVKLTEQLHINLLGPLLALFFASMLVGEDVEGHTIPFVLTRPLPRSAWLLGKFLAYVAVAATLLLTSMALTFAACTSLANLAFDRPGLTLLAHYGGVAVFGLAAYGTFAAFLGATTRRPIVIGVILLYAWQKLANMVPGLIDFMTIQKYTDALLPKLATQRGNLEIQTALGTFQKEIFAISATKAGITLAIITASFFIMTVLAIRWREHASARAVGS